MSNLRKEHRQNESFKKYYGKYEPNEYDEYGKSPTNVNEYAITEKSTSISTISNAYEQWPNPQAILNQMMGNLNPQQKQQLQQMAKQFGIR